MNYIDGENNYIVLVRWQHTIDGKLLMSMRPSPEYHKKTLLGCSSHDGYAHARGECIKKTPRAKQSSSWFLYVGLINTGGIPKYAQFTTRRMDSTRFQLINGITGN
jgi:hypothetical protein